jgi:triosephosphate isomerase
MKTLLLNFKNYPEVLGPGSVELSLAAAKVAKKVKAEVIVAPPTSMLGLVASRVDIQVFSQSLGKESGEKTTGANTPEAVAGARASGALLNHSEARIPMGSARIIVARARELGLRICLCSRDTAEAVRLARLKTEYVAVEPPELIGSGIAVSKARPQVVSGTVRALRSAGYGGSILCGAGIVTGEDVRKAVSLGADGVLVSSSVVKARDWEARIGELAASLI